MNRHDDRPAGPRGPAQTTTGPFPLPRPYVEQGLGPQPQRPAPPQPAPPQPRFTPRAEAAPHPQFIPRPAHPAPRPAQARRPVVRRAGRRHGPPMRAIIGDELRIPILWCEFGTCIEHYTHADALGERDLRERALAAGWRYDLLGRLACPACVQHDASFWVARPPVPAQRRSASDQ